MHDGQSLGLRFEKIVEQYPENTALRYSSQNFITYTELNYRVNQIARFLLGKGIGKNDVICITSLKIINTFASILACLKIGALYSVIDRDSPLERLKKIIGNCSPKLLLVDDDFKERLTLFDFCGKIISIADIEFENNIGSYSVENLRESESVGKETLAYIMYTSGSTGTPKGAVMTHANVCNFISWSVVEFNFTADDVLTNLNPLFFDNSVFDLYSSLFCGACLVPFDIEKLKDPKSVIEFIDECKCTSWFSVPSLLIYFDSFRVFCGDNFKYMKRIIFGGEGYPKSKLKSLYDIYADRVELINVYGPTECTCMCSAYRIRTEDLDDVNGLPPLGKIIDNFDYLILDEENNEVKQGESGELCLLGPQVGKGYYHDIERTKQSFVRNPFNAEREEIMYKTGDLVKIDPCDGKFYFTSRKDNQIKHMGYRIELGEIEYALNALKYIVEAAVIYGEIKGFKQIVAIVKARDVKSESQIRNDLKKIIPSYMIPQRINVTEEIPKNSNGKIDRRKLANEYLQEVVAV